uniref:Uncharacterized protein n=1 Tax=Hucho hucho TaxID=62062 RepID=A0A4W5QCZ1_9TELE
SSLFLRKRGRRKGEMKSRWNCGSMTCIMCLTCVGSQLSINSSNAISFNTHYRVPNWKQHQHKNCPSGAS